MNGLEDFDLVKVYLKCIWQVLHMKEERVGECNDIGILQYSSLSSLCHSRHFFGALL